MRYLVSACLTGRSCRYNGSHCVHPLYKEMLENGEAVPFCPEVLGGLSIPRDPAEIRMMDGEKKVLTEAGQDVTAAFIIGADLSAGLAEREGIACAVLKNGSPSCGFGKIYDGNFRGQLIPGQGICADILAEKGLFLFNEESFAASRDVTLKKLREDDLKELIQISRDAFLQDSRENSPYGEGGPEGYDSIPWHREAVSRGRFYTIRLKNKIVGGLFYSLKTDRSGWVNRIFVKPDFQGRGIGRRVFFLLEQKHSRITSWGLDTPVWAEHNQNFYKSMGYEPVREIFSREAGYNLVVLKKIRIQEAGARPVQL